MRDLTDIIERYLIAKGKGDSSAWAAKLWAVTKNQKMAGKVRDPLRLFVTDVGKCHRAVWYRLHEEPRRDIPPAKRVMFEEAEDIETIVAAAMKWEGVLQDYQQGVDLSDRENWGGRKDITLVDPLTVEVKSSRSNAFKGDKELPKRDHITQVTIYSHYDDIPACLLYVDRGGENEMQQHAVDYDPFAWDAISAEMDELDDMRANGKSAPPTLPLVLTRRAVRKSSIVLGDLRLDWSGEVWLGPDWRCRYCDYMSCPNKGLNATMLCKMMKTKPMDLTSEGRRHEDDVYQYLRSGQREMSLA